MNKLLSFVFDRKTTVSTSFIASFFWCSNQVNETKVTAENLWEQAMLGRLYRPTMFEADDCIETLPDKFGYLSVELCEKLSAVHYLSFTIESIIFLRTKKLACVFYKTRKLLVLVAKSFRKAFVCKAKNTSELCSF